MENFITLTPRGQTFGFQILKSFLTPRKKEEKEKAEQSRAEVAKMAKQNQDQNVAAKLILKCIFQMDHPRPLFVNFRSFSINLQNTKTVDFSGIQIWIVGAEGEHADHSKTTMTLF